MNIPLFIHPNSHILLSSFYIANNATMKTFAHILGILTHTFLLNISQQWNYWIIST